MQSKRQQTNGFTLIEAIAAIAVIALVSIPLAGALTSNVSFQKKIETQIAEREFAYSLLERIDAERNFENETGNYKGRFSYSTIISPIAPPTLNRYSELIEHIEITVQVDDLSGSGDGYSMRQVFTRKRAE